MCEVDGMVTHALTGSRLYISQASTPPHRRAERADGGQSGTMSGEFERIKKKKISEKFVREEQSVNQHVERYPTSSAIRELQTKTTMAPPSHPLRWL
jgi:hypothetical protein